jgi:homoserine kinase
VRRLHVPPVIGAVALGFDALGLAVPQIDGSQLTMASA